jgi:serine/threonine protein kinase
MDLDQRQQEAHEHLLDELSKQQQQFSGALINEIRAMIGGQEQLRPETIQRLEAEVKRGELSPSARHKLILSVGQVARVEKLRKERDATKASLLAKDEEKAEMVRELEAQKLARRRSRAQKEAELKAQQAEIARLRALSQHSMSPMSGGAAVLPGSLIAGGIEETSKIGDVQHIVTTPRGNTVFRAILKETHEPIVGKTHVSTTTLKRETEWLQWFSKHHPKNELVVRYKGLDGDTVLLERAEDSLDRYITEHQRMEGADVRMWLSKTLKILEFLHAESIAHNDVKPANLLVFPRNVLKAGDFDAAAKFGDVRDKDVTPFICSPEVARYIRGEGRFEGEGAVVDDKADVWAVGVTALQMLSVR